MPTKVSMDGWSIQGYTLSRSWQRINGEMMEGWLYSGDSRQWFVFRRRSTEFTLYRRNNKNAQFNSECVKGNPQVIVWHIKSVDRATIAKVG